MNLKNLSFALFASGALLSCSVPAPRPYGALPTPAQVEWQKMETNMFIHFGPNTFTGAEWGDGQEPADIFNPTALDCRQWVAVAKAGGMKGNIITAKHHDGFCLWPNPESRHTVAQSPWKGGKGDVLRELSDACREAGIKFGIYISPWDRHDPHYGSDAYNEVFRRTLEHALTNYGEVFEQWFDGACGEGPNGKRQVYDWDLFHAEVFKHQPQAVIFSDSGPGCRWIGNERGYAGRTCWSRLDTTGLANNYHRDTLNQGNRLGEAWIPGEADVSIRPGWFYRKSEDNQVKSLAELLKIYYASTGRNSLMLLNIPPDERGLICSVDSARMVEFRAAIDALYAVDYTAGATVEASNVRGGNARYAAENLLSEDYDRYWATDDEVTAATVTLRFPEPRTFNRVLLQEYIPLGQRVEAFHVDWLDAEGEWHELARETTIGYKRILPVDRTTAHGLRIVIDKALACPVLNRVMLLQDNCLIDAPVAERDKQGRTTLRLADGRGEIRYTLDGSAPTPASTLYTGPITLPGAAELRAMGVVDGRPGDVLNVSYDIAPARFAPMADDTASHAVVDGLSDDGADPLTRGAVFSDRTPVAIDLGEVLTLKGFTYEPLRNGREGVIIEYDLEFSLDSRHWVTAVEGAMFDNIVNNPIRQAVRLPQPVKARYMRIVPRRTDRKGQYGVGEVGVLTK